MTRHMGALCALVATCTTCAPALAVFTGIDLREDKGQIPPVELATIDPMGLGVRVINLYATFDGPGDWTDERPRSANAVLNTSADSQRTGDVWRVDKSGGRHADAYYYQDAFGGNLAPLEAIIDLFPTVRWDTYAGCGLKTVPPGETLHTYTDPDFAFLDQDGDGLHDALTGGVPAGFPPAEHHVATFNPGSNQYEVFLMQLTIVGLDAGADLGRLRNSRGADGMFEWESDIFLGAYTVYTQDPDAGAFRWDIQFVAVPAPAPIALAVPCAMALARRRRCRV